MGNKHLTALESIEGSLWAILPAKLDEINAFLTARANNEQAVLDLEALQQKNGNRAQDSYRVQDGVAVIPAYGVLAKRMNLMMRVSGGTSTELLQRDIEAALDDPTVLAILLDIDSPGGTVDGTKDAADAVFAGRAKKPIVAYGNGMMASAAYWIGSAADTVVVNPTAAVGSLGILGVHIDRSGQDEKIGIKRTVLATGEYKGVAGDEKPLSPEGRDYIFSLMQPVHDLFAESVAQHRGMALHGVHENLMDGRVFIGKQAVSAGLADRIGNFDDAMALARQKGKEKQMDVSKLKAEHPAVFDAVFQAGADSLNPKIADLTGQLDQKVSEAKAAGETNERTRCVKLLLAKADPDATLKAIREGTPAADAFEVFYLAERDAKQKRLSEIKETLPESAGGQGRESAASEEEPADFMAEVEKHMQEAKCTRAQAVKAMVKKKPELHAKWLEAQRGGK